MKIFYWKMNFTGLCMWWCWAGLKPFEVIFFLFPLSGVVLHLSTGGDVLGLCWVPVKQPAFSWLVCGF